MRLVTLILIIGLGFLFKLEAQDSLDVRLNQPLIDCEKIAFNSQELIAEFDIIQADTISIIIDKWEAICGSSEPSQRVKILSAIAAGYFSAENFKNYYKYPLYYYKVRDEISRDSTTDNKNEYQRSRSYFDHVPIDGALDNWTNEVAANLIVGLNPQSDAYLLCLLFSKGTEAFDEALQKRSKQSSYIKKIMYDQIYSSWNNGLTITLSGGTWIPLSNKETNFGISPQFGIAFGASIRKNWSVHLGVMFKFWTDQNSIIVNYENIDSVTTSSFSGFIGAVINRTFPVKENFFIEPNIGLGLEVLDTELDEPDNSTDDNQSFSIETINLTLGTNFRMKVGKRSSIGLNISYHYTPHHFDKDLISELNPHAISTNLIFKF